MPSVAASVSSILRISDAIFLLRVQVKLEKIHWNKYDNVIILQMAEHLDPMNARCKEFWFRVHWYHHDKMEWEELEPKEIPRSWFKKLRVE